MTLITCTSIIKDLKSLLFLLFVFLFLLFPSNVFAQVVINEFSSSTDSDWIELFALEEVDISGWFLDDDGTVTNMAVIPEGTIMGASTYYVVQVSKRLNKSGDIISLFTKDSVLVDKVSYGDKGGVCIPLESGSIGRYPDANSTIERFSTPTKGTSNDSAHLDPCPTPTPNPSPTSTPTPTAARTPTPTLTLTPTSTPKPVVKAVSTANLTPKTTDSTVSAINLKPIYSPSPTPTPEPKTGNKPPFLAGVLILTGIGAIGFAGYTILSEKRKTREGDN